MTMDRDREEQRVIDADNEEDLAREIADHERWLMTEGADYLFENGRGE